MRGDGVLGVGVREGADDDAWATLMQILAARLNTPAADANANAAR